MDEQLKSIISTLEELCEDNTVPRNIKSKFQKIITSLKDPENTSIKVNKALHEFDEINEDANIQPYIRTQIWNISSMLEKVSKTK